MIIHSLPCNDLYPHTENLWCACGPVVEQHENGKLILHNAWDGRDADDSDITYEGDA